MGILIPSLFIAIIGGLIYFFNPHIANYFFPSIYLIFAFSLSMRAEIERKKFLAGEKKRQEELLLILTAPILFKIVIFLILLFYFSGIQLINLFWAIPLLYFIFEIINARKFNE